MSWVWLPPLQDAKPPVLSLAQHDQLDARAAETGQWIEAMASQFEAVGRWRDDIELVAAVEERFQDRVQHEWRMACEHHAEISPRLLFSGGLGVAETCRRS